MNSGARNTRTFSWGLVRTVLIVFCLLIVVSWTYMSISAQTDDTEKLPWTESPAADAVTPEKAAELTGASAESFTVVWSSDYETTKYPATVKLKLAGLDGLTVCVFEKIDGEWKLLTVGVAPTVQVPVDRGGTISAAVTSEEIKTPEGKVIIKAPETGVSKYWIIATVAVTSIAIVFALVVTRKKDS